MPSGSQRNSRPRLFLARNSSSTHNFRALVDERGNVVGGGVGQIERAGGAGRERGAAGERELRGEKQFPARLPGIRAGSVGEVEGAGDEGAEVRGGGEVSRAGGGAGAGVLRGAVSLPERPSGLARRAEDAPAALRRSRGGRG